jgi:hypothetical protein
MSSQARCHCQSCTIRGLMGPAILITLGVLFLLHQLHGGRFDFGNTWPVLMVVIGLLLLASSVAPQDGHIETQIAAMPPTSTVPPPMPPANPPQSPYGSQGQ